RAQRSCACDNRGMGRGASVSAAVAVVLLLSACGSSSSNSSSTQPDTSSYVSTTITLTTSPSKTASGGLPKSVPLKGNGKPATSESKRVIKAWLAALSDGKIAKAASFFAPRARVQNGTSPFVLRSRAERLAFNRTLPCGAKPHALEGAAHGYTIVTFLLT